nr:transposase (putative), gypsy type [Tanacetum cinerariifolium]
ITDIRSLLTQRALTIFCETYHIPDEVHSQLPSPNQTIHEMSIGKIGVYTSKGVPKDPFPKSSEFNAEHYATLVALPTPFHKYPESFLCLVGISRYYTLDEDAYPEFLSDNDDGMDLLAFIRTADPTKVRVAERQRAEDEPRVLESTVGRVVPLLPIAPARASSELKASVDKLFDEGASGDGQDADFQPVAVTNINVEDVAPLQPRRQRKRKTDVADVGRPSHPSKKLREDFRALGGVPTTGKSMAAVQSLFSGAMLEAGARGEPITTLPFVTSSVSATSEREDRSPTDSVPGPNLRTIGAPQRFVISPDSSYHSGANIAEAEVDSIIRSSAPAIATVTTVTTAFDTKATASRARVAPSLFGVGSSSTGRTDCSWEKRKLRAVVDEHAELLKTKDGEIESLKSQLLLKETEAAEAIRLRAEVFKFESTEQSLKGEVGFLRDQNTALESEKNELNVKVHELKISSTELQEKVAAYEGFCLNSTEYLTALGAAISKAVEKGMQEGLSAGITHGAEGRQLADVAAYNPSAEADYLSALQHLQSVNFSLIVELESNKDASVDTIMNLLRLDDVLAERLGLTESQPHVDQLMVPIHHSPDQHVVGASALTFSLEVSNSRVKEMRENIANHVSALRDVFVPLSKPLSAAALEGMECTSGSTPDVTATLSTTLVSASTISPISTDDYEVAHAEGQGGARVDDETAADDDINLFVSNVDFEDFRVDPLFS